MSGGDISKHVDPVLLGRMIRRVRMQQGKTQTEMAAGIVSTGYFSRIESGTRLPTPAVLDQIAARLGMTSSGLTEAAGADPNLIARMVADATVAWLDNATSQQAYVEMLSAADRWREFAGDAPPVTDEGFEPSVTLEIATANGIFRTTLGTAQNGPHG